jgi:hypothetical protein
MLPAIPGSFLRHTGEGRLHMAKIDPGRRRDDKRDGKLAQSAFRLLEFTARGKVSIGRL